MTSTIVETAFGRVQGQMDRGCRVWKGIPFATVAKGAGRFRAAAPAQAWPGIREARSFGPACPQAIGNSKPHASGSKHSEDCLFLNIWAPVDSAGRTPVALWIYGGAFLAGSADLYDGAHLAASGNIVVVTANYRTGPFGFVNFGSLPGGEELESNAGLRDQMAALHWIRDNIAAFGGDPQRVTVMGESAGSISIALLMQSRQARGLFHGAIMASGATTLIHDLEMSQRVARAYVKELQLGGDPLPKLRTVEATQLLLAQQRIGNRLRTTLPAAPWFDGELLPASPAESLATPSAPVPLLAGRTRDETRTFEILPGPPTLPLLREEVGRLLLDQLGEREGETILDSYPTGRKGRRQLSTDATFSLPTLHFAERHSQHSPAWLYRFDCRNPLFGAMHGIDLLYLWDAHGFLPMLARGGPLSGRRAELAQRFRSAWTNFVRTGSPGNDWSALDTTTRYTKLFDLEDRVVADPEKARREVWAGRDVFIGLSRAHSDAALLG